MANGRSQFIAALDVGSSKISCAVAQPLDDGYRVLGAASRRAEGLRRGVITDMDAAEAAITALKEAAASGANIMEPSITAAKAGVTTGEWGTALREVFGEYRGPTGVALTVDTRGDEDVEKTRRRVEALSESLGRQLTYVLGKPGLDGHSNGAEQIASRARLRQVSGADRPGFVAYACACVMRPIPPR